MARRANPAMIGAFVLGAVVLGVAALAVFGGGKFFRHTVKLVAYFDGSLKGMAIGAPVTFNGVKIGSVTDFKVIIDTKNRISEHDITPTAIITTPVYFEIDAGRLYLSTGKKIKLRRDGSRLRKLYARGFRAQLELASLVTGQLEVALNFHADTPLRLTGLSKDVPEVPTIPSSIEKLSKSLEKLPIDEMVADVREALDAINRLANAPEVKAILRDVSRAVVNADTLIGNTDKLVRSVNAEVPALMAQVNKTSESAQTTLKELQAVVSRVGGGAESALAEYQQLAKNADTQLAGDALLCAHRHREHDGGADAGIHPHTRRRCARGGPARGARPAADRHALRDELGPAGGVRSLVGAIAGHHRAADRREPRGATARRPCRRLPVDAGRLDRAGSHRRNHPLRGSARRPLRARGALARGGHERTPGAGDRTHGRHRKRRRGLCVRGRRAESPRRPAERRHRRRHPE